MKLRVKGNSIRLRLTQPEVQRMQTEKKVYESIDFGDDAVLHYELRSEPCDKKILPIFKSNRITIVVDQAVINDWADSDKVSISGNYEISDQNHMILLVEKDFKCLSPRDEDETDMFPHPDQNN
ncbi:MAG TPA: hypothetical protein QGF04_04255 [Woeseiaceae bacterium]|jgi:hypothetical protein|nr:hypothetical protein [Woeseiaceae bacterium]|tara:strand:- start:4404 stop:4775 length:372 start_codon:yes stop_codon:yes gene_type:complete